MSSTFSDSVAGIDEWDPDEEVRRMGMQQPSASPYQHDDNVGAPLIDADGGGDVDMARRRLYSSAEYLFPPPQCETRQTTTPTAVFSLVCTICGGGVLSLPFAFAKAGILCGLLFIFIVSVASDFSVYILVSCSRRTGANSYDAVVLTALGRHAQIACVGLVFMILFLALVAYQLLLGNLAGSLVTALTGVPLSTAAEHYLVLMLLAAIVPLALQRTLHALRFTSVFGVFNITVLACVLSSVLYSRGVPAWHEWPWLPPADAGIMGPLYSFPIICVAFLCHFNVLPLHCELLEPTRKRISRVINWVMLLCSLLYGWVALVGVGIALSATPGNILAFFPPDDRRIMVARVALSLTLVLNIPLIVLPCRLALKKMIILYSELMHPSPALCDDSMHHTQRYHSDRAADMSGRVVDDATDSDDDTSFKYGRADADVVPATATATAMAAAPVPTETTYLLSDTAAAPATAAASAAPVATSASPTPSRGARSQSMATPDPGQHTHSHATTGRRARTQSQYTYATPTDPAAAAAAAAASASSSFSLTSSSAQNAKVASFYAHVGLSARALGDEDEQAVRHPVVHSPFSTPVLKYREQQLTALAARDAATAELLTDADHVDDALGESSTVHLVQTLGIVFVPWCLTLVVTSIETVWSIAGSTAAVVIAYILPGLCYLIIRQKKRFTLIKAACLVMMLLGAVAFVLCSWVAFYKLFHPPPTPTATMTGAGAASTATSHTPTPMPSTTPPHPVL